MSVVEDASSPAAVSTTAQWFSTPLTTASFTPPAACLLVAIIAGGNGASALTASIADSHSGTWTNKGRANTTGAGGFAGTAEVWFQYNATSPGAMTVSATSSASSVGAQLKVMCLTGASPTQTGNAVTNVSRTTSGTLQCSVAAGTGGKVYGAYYDWTSNTAITVLGNTTEIASQNDTTNGARPGSFKSTGDTAGTATYGYSSSVQGQITAVEVLAVGGTNYTPSQSDAEGITDAATPVQDNVRSQADAVGLADSATTAAADVRTQSDSVGITDAANPLAANARAQADAVGLTDAASGVAANARTQADAVGITDALVAAVGPTRQQDDPEGITDLLAATQVLIRALADPVGLVDAANPTQALARTVADPVGVTDSLSGVISGGGSAYSAFLDADSSLLTWAHDSGGAVNLGTTFYTTSSGQTCTGVRYWLNVLSPTGSGTLIALYAVDLGTGFPTGSPLATGTLVGTETAGAWNTVSFGTPYALSSNTPYAAVVLFQNNAYSTDSAYFSTPPTTDGPADTGAAGLFLARDASGTFIARNGTFNYDTTGYTTTTPPNGSFGGTWYGVDPLLFGTGGGYAPNVSDSEGITDNAVAVQANVRVQADPIGLTDAPSTIVTVSRTVIDPVGITDSAVAAISGTNYSLTINDAIGITDTGLQQAIDYSEILGPDAVGITDSLTGVISGGGSPVVTDPEGITDQLGAVQNDARAVADTVGLTDSAAGVQAVARTQSDSIGITDSASAVLIPAGASVVTDPEGITDQLTPVQAQFVSPSDPVGVTDVLTASVGFLRALADSVGLTDSVAASLGLLRTLSDAVGIADLLTASLNHTPVNYTVTINDPIGITDSAGSVNPARDLDLDIMAAAQRWLVTIDALRWEVR